MHLQQTCTKVILIMKNITTIKSFLMAFLLLGLMACDNDDPEPVNEEELITTVRVTFTPPVAARPL